MTKPSQIAYQGEPGAFSHLACAKARPDHIALPCATFEDAIAAVQDGRAELAMLPVENSVAGRVTDIHHLLPDSDLSIIGEFFLPLRLQLMAPKGADLADLAQVRSHAMALGQCRRFIAQHALKKLTAADTAGAARQVAERGDAREAALASELAAEIYGLDILERDVEDAAHNTTRFLIMAREPADPEPDSACVTTFVFQVRNVPAALFKALGGFATNGVNITKLESYQEDGTFLASRFYADAEGRPDNRAFSLALEELGFFSNRVKVLGVYPAHPYRFEARRFRTPAQS
ncbi:MAG: prephenate dehydratase [Maricaulaceae bacterium]